MLGVAQWAPFAALSSPGTVVVTPVEERIPILAQTVKAGVVAVRSRLRSVARRGVERVVVVVDNARQRAGTADSAELRRAYDRVLWLYEELRRGFAARRVAPSQQPSQADIEFVRAEVLKGKPFLDFFRTLSLEGDIEAATVAATRRMNVRSERGRARAFLQVFARYAELRPIAEVCLGLCAVAEPMPDSAWTLFTRNDPGLVLRWAGAEYFALAFVRDPDGAAATLERVLGGQLALGGDAEVWVQVAYYAFAAGKCDLAEQCLERATTATAAKTDVKRDNQLRARVATLREWLERAERARRVVDLPTGDIAFGVVGFAHPDRRSISGELADRLNSLAGLAHLLRHDGLALTGEAGLVSAAERVRAGAAPERRLPGPARTVRLYEVDRDLSRYAEVPEGTWVIVSDWFAAPLPGSRYDLPLDSRLRPLFVSFRIEPAQLSAPGAVEYLRAHGPVGCRDWETVLLLLGAGVPAFFSGALETTLDLLVPPAETGVSGGPVSGAAPRGVPGRGLGNDLAAAAAALRGYRGAAAPVVTADLRVHLAARAVGRASRFRPDKPWHGAVSDYLTLSDEQLQAMRDGICDKLASVLGALIDGASTEKVYETWHAACTEDVAAAEREMRSFPEFPKLDFDVDEVCDAIRAESVTIERREPGPDGPEINVEFSLDANYTHQMEIVLDSVVEHATRPVRAFMCSRGLEQHHVDRLVQLFPTVSFVWLRTDGIEYGKVGSKNKWVTMVTMDRIILPALLPDVDRIIHFDLDALCLADLAELFDVDMKGAAIAACDEPQPNHVDGFVSVRRVAARLRREGTPGLAREFLIRIHAEHSVDFECFNAGIMVLDLAKMRADDFVGRHLSYVPRFGANGQLVLNYYVGAARTKLDPDWNRLVRLEVAPTPKIAHWAGPFKPWAGHAYVADRELWREQEERFEQRTRALAAATAPVR